MTKLSHTLVIALGCAVLALSATCPTHGQTDIHKDHKWRSPEIAKLLAVASGRVYKVDSTHVSLTVGDGIHVISITGFDFSGGDGRILTDLDDWKVRPGDFVTIIYCSGCYRIRYLIHMGDASELGLPDGARSKNHYCSVPKVRGR